MVDLDRIAPTRRPQRRPIGYHRWHSLAFIHWRVSPDLLAPQLPKGVQVDTFDGSAWIGLVPFHMSGVRPWWSPSILGISAFHETNVRTYVHCNGVPGVWFFSLDAASRLAVWIARTRWGLPYHHARMQVRRDGSRVEYQSRRTARVARDATVGPGVPGAGVDLEIEFDEAAASEGIDEQGHARPGTLEHFLVERYVLFVSELGRPTDVLSGRVHHSPYPLQSARWVRGEQSLVQAAGFEIDGPPDHVAFTEGVSVEIFGLRSAGEG
ncbi:MAG: DUF2071 domain-containing protein [Planctomycetaceae bacterium]